MSEKQDQQRRIAQQMQAFESDPMVQALGGTVETPLDTGVAAIPKATAFQLRDSLRGIDGIIVLEQLDETLGAPIVAIKDDRDQVGIRWKDFKYTDPHTASRRLGHKLLLIELGGMRKRGEGAYSYNPKDIPVDGWGIYCVTGYSR